MVSGRSCRIGIVSRCRGGFTPSVFFLFGCLGLFCGFFGCLAGFLGLFGCWFGTVLLLNSP